jgi:hypothetical protein
MTKDGAKRLQRAVAEERARVDETIDAIQHRLTPGQMIDEVLRQGRGVGNDFVSSLGRTLSANPIPTALVGVGRLWLLFAPRAEQPSGAPDDSASPTLETKNVAPDSPHP